MTLPISERIILDLCGGTGGWSRPYVEAGYDVRLITLPEFDVLTYDPPDGVWGVLAAPPCTEFAVSGARWWKKKALERPELLRGACRIVLACQRIISRVHPKWWALENPVGRLRRLLGPPDYYFQPWEYGDPWTKKTCIWGTAKEPKKSPVDPVGQWVGGSYDLGIVDNFEGFLPPDWIHKLPQTKNRAALRSVTPPGFARAFFKTNP